MFVALDKTLDVLVAIKKVELLANDEKSDSEWKLLKACQSPLLVKYCDVMRREGECL